MPRSDDLLADGPPTEQNPRRPVAADAPTSIPKRRRRHSHPTKLVFQVFLDSPEDETYGFELARAAGLPSGTIYPILRRLEDEGIVTSRWGEVDDAELGTRRRRYYRLTAEGRRVARQATAKEEKALRLLAPGWSS